MQKLIGKKVLITTQGWFYGHDGKQYKSVFGTLNGIHEAGKTMGFIPNRAHANWFVEIGRMVIMGCQVLYINQCDTVNEGPVKDWMANERPNAGITEYERPCTIYFAD
jgi:hypothetical protein